MDQEKSEKKEEKTLKIRRIKTGTVIDHIPCGRALHVLRILKLPDPNYTSPISIVMNVGSRTSKRKDIVKIEDRILDATELNKISLIAPSATINIIQDFEVREKKTVQLPQVIVDILKCQNPNCISNKGEPVTGKFYIYTKKPLKLKCAFCERIQMNILEHVV